MSTALLLLAASSCLLLPADAQSEECQGSYNAFGSANMNCRNAFGYVPNGNVLAPLRTTFSDSALDTLCSGNDCRSRFVGYFRRCITETQLLGGPPEFYTGTLDTRDSSLINLENAVCRKDCAGAGRYCYTTVRSTLRNTTCDDVTSTCSPACQQALDWSGCCGQNAFRTKNRNVESVCCLQDFYATCQELAVDCPADLPGTSCSLIATTPTTSVPPPPTSIPPPPTSVPSPPTSIPPPPTSVPPPPTSVPSPPPSSPPPSRPSSPPSQTSPPTSPTVESTGQAHVHPVAVALVVVPALLITSLMVAGVL